MKQLPEHGSCFICGSENPHNLGIHWYVDGKGVVSSEFTLTLAQQEPPGHARGGLYGSMWPIDLVSFPDCRLQSSNSYPFLILK